MYPSPHAVRAVAAENPRGDPQIRDAYDMDAGDALDLRQKHCAELACADDADAYRVVLNVAFLKLFEKAHGRLPLGKASNHDVFRNLRADIEDALIPNNLIFWTHSLFRIV